MGQKTHLTAVRELRLLLPKFNFTNTDVEIAQWKSKIVIPYLSFSLSLSLSLSLCVCVKIKALLFEESLYARGNKQLIHHFGSKE